MGVFWCVGHLLFCLFVFFFDSTRDHYSVYGAFRDGSLMYSALQTAGQLSCLVSCQMSSGVIKSDQIKVSETHRAQHTALSLWLTVTKHVPQMWHCNCMLSVYWWKLIK